MRRSKNKKSKKTWLIASGLIAVLLIGFRLYLPSLVLHVVNKKLTEIDGYTGHIQDIDIRLLAGAYRIKNMELNKVGGKIPVPFFSAYIIDISVEWKALLKGAVVAEIEVDRPILNFVKGPTEATTQTSIDKDWQDVVDDLIPLRINRFTVSKGEIHYRDFHSTPKIDLLSERIEIIAENLSNANDAKELLPSSAKATAFIYGGIANLDMKLNPLEKTPTFDLNAELKNLDVVKLNDFFKAYGNFDVHNGTVGIYVEAAAKDNKLSGYTKPIIKDLKVFSWKQDSKDPIKLLWEGIIAAGAWVFKNHPNDQLATQVSFEGNLDNPDINTWDIIGETLRNAFIQALYPSIENSVSINSPDKIEKKENGLLKNIIPSKNKREQRREERKEKRKQRRKS